MKFFFIILIVALSLPLSSQNIQHNTIYSQHKIDFFEKESVSDELSNHNLERFHNFSISDTNCMYWFYFDTLGKLISNTVNLNFNNPKIVLGIGFLNVTGKIEGPEVVCNSNPVNYVFNIPDGYGASWSCNSGTVYPDIYDGSVYIAWTGTGALNLTLTAPNGCVTVKSIAVSLVAFDAEFFVNPKSDICTNDPVLLINRSLYDENISYDWSMTGADITSYSGFSPDLINYSQNGQYTVELTISSQGCSSTFSKNIDVLENCCEHDYFVTGKSDFTASIGKEDDITTFSGGGVFEGTYYVEGTIVLTDGTYQVNDGSVFYINPECEDCNKIADLQETCNIFEESRTQIVLINAELVIGDAEFRSVCEEMWYGIALYNGSEFITTESQDREYAHIMDALAGIIVCDVEAQSNNYDIERMSFVNNIFGLHEVGMNESPDDYRVSESIIDSKSDFMKYPYSERISHCGIYMSTYLHPNAFHYNELRNTDFGYYHESLDYDYKSFEVTYNQFRDFHIAGIAFGNSDDQSKIENCQFNYPEDPLGNSDVEISEYESYIGTAEIYPTSGIYSGAQDPNWNIGAFISNNFLIQYNKFYGQSLPYNQQEKQIGIYSRVMHDYEYATTGAYFRQNYLEHLNTAYYHPYCEDFATADYLPANYISVSDNDFISNDLAMYIAHPSLGPFNILENRFTTNRNGVHIEYIHNPLVIEDNHFLDNDTSIAVMHDNNSDPLDLTLGCNKFELDNVETYDRYGLFVHQDADMGTVGGNQQQGTNFKDPAGNNWPVDIANSPGYPYITTGNAGNTQVNNYWESPDLWYSIYDYNTSPGWNYWRWKNEYVGDADNAVSPSSVIALHNVDAKNYQVCFNVPNINFPQAKLGRNVDSTINNAIDKKLHAYPVPVEDMLTLKVEGTSIDLVELFNARGVKISFIRNENETPEFTISTKHLARGYYIAKVFDKKGEIHRIGIVK